MQTVKFTLPGSQAVLPVQVDGADGGITVPGYKGMGTVRAASLDFSTAFVVVAAVYDVTGDYGVARLSTTFTAKFSSGKGAPDFEDVVITSFNTGDEVLVGPFGVGTPFTGATAGKDGVSISTAKTDRDFFISLETTGVNTPTFNGVPQPSATPTNQAEMTVEVNYDVAPVMGTARADRMGGTVHADAVNLAGGNDRFNGRGGDDHIQGAGGNDTLTGGGGSDRILGHSGNDVLIGGTGADRILGGAGNDRIQGGAGKDVLEGGSGNDRIAGGDQGDQLIGGLGGDQLSGGAGSDVFVFLTAKDSPGRSTLDRITDMDAADRIDLSAIDADRGTAGHQDFAFSQNGPTANSVWVGRGPDGMLVVRADVNGDRKPDMAFLVDGLSSLTADDFLV